MSESSLPELLIFEVSGIYFSMPLSAVEEVVLSSAVTRTPNSPPFFLGLAAVRGKVMGVIDAALRYGLASGLRSYFVVCHVRGNITAITIDRPVVAGAVSIRALGAEELERLRLSTKVDKKFIKSGFELLESAIYCLEVEPDLFVSAEMASRVGEAA